MRAALGVALALVALGVPVARAATGHLVLSTATVPTPGASVAPGSPGVSAAPLVPEGAMQRAPPALTAPAILLTGVGREVRVELGALEGRVGAVVFILRDNGRIAALVRREVSGTGPITAPLVVPWGSALGRTALEARLLDGAGEPVATLVSAPRVLPGWVSFIPPALAIALALWWRQVLPALLSGVLCGAFIRADFDPLAAVLRTLDHDLVEALAESADPAKGHLKIVLFTLLLGGLVGIVSRSGGAGGLVRAASRWARGRRGGQLTAWLAGLIVFFDDYANTLVVGPALRPLTDAQRISREKLAFIVDATAAPVASLAVISTWVGYEVGLIADALHTTSLAGIDPYGVFLASLPYRFYAWLMLGAIVLIALTNRDFGPMLAAERRAVIHGESLRPGSQPLARTDLDAGVDAAPPGRAIVLALVPILALVTTTFASLWLSGRAALAAAGESAGTLPPLAVLGSMRGIGEVLGAASSFNALLYGAATGVLVALAAALLLRRLNLPSSMGAFTDGVAAMTLAVVILTLAWMIGGICKELGTAEVAVQLVGEGLPARLVPAAVFVIAGAISFATGSSWTTMAVLVPVALPLADRLGAAAGLTGADLHQLVLAATGSVLTGAVFGDHCSPISDTTVMSSLATGCDHIDHVRTQMPYALAVGAVSLLAGDLAVGFGLSPWLGLGIGLGVMAALLFVVGRPVPKVE